MKTANSIMLMVIALLAGSNVWAGCESSLLKGSHTALTKKEAKIGAWEDAKEVCYPGKAEKVSLWCEKVEGEKGVQGKSAKRCVQEVACNVCGEALTRRYEALD